MKSHIIQVNEEVHLFDKEDAYGLDLLKINNSNFHVLKSNQGYAIEVLKQDFRNKCIRLLVNGNTYEVQIKDTYDQMVKNMGLLSNTNQSIKDVKAPMPGLIMAVLVEVGQEIKEGTPLLVLSAMKMENQILAQGAGIIKSVEVKVGDTVDKGQLIIEMEL